MHLFTKAQIALKNGIDYATVLGHLKIARSKGLTVPVLLMGKVSDQAVTILNFINVITKRLLQSSTCLRRRQSYPRRCKSRGKWFYYGRPSPRGSYRFSGKMCSGSVRVSLNQGTSGFDHSLDSLMCRL
jgi:hypothetical protein